MEGSRGVCRHPRIGWFLIGCGIIGLVGGIVPFVFNGLRVVTGHPVILGVDTAAHGVDAMRLSPEWAMLSSAMGTYLGLLLVWSGAGWRKGRAWAPLVTWAYVLCGLAVNGTDMVIFAFQATPGAMRTQMLVLDGIASLLVVVVGVWLVRERARRAAAP